MNLSSITPSNQIGAMDQFLPTEIQVVTEMHDQFTLAQFARKTEEQATERIIKTFQKFKEKITQMFTEQAELNTEYRKKAETERSEEKVAAALHREEMRALSERIDQLANDLREAKTKISTLEEKHLILENRFNGHQHAYEKPKKRYTKKSIYTEISNK